MSEVKVLTADRAMRIDGILSIVDWPGNVEVHEALKALVRHETTCIETAELDRLRHYAMANINPLDAAMVDEIERLRAGLAAATDQIEHLQRALSFWLPQVPDNDDEVARRVGDDAYRLAGYDGDDERSAEQLGWITLRVELAAARRIGAQMSNICFNLAQDDSLPLRTRETMTRCRKEWDALPTPPAPEPPHAD